MFALCSLGVSTAVLSYDTHRIAREAEQSLRDIDSAVKIQSGNLATDEAQLGLVLEHVDAAAIEQRAYWQKTSTDSDKTVKALRLTVDRASLLLKHADEQLNTSLLPDMDRELVLTTHSAQMGIDSFSHASEVLAFDLDDPNISQLAAHLNEASAQLSTSAAHIADGTAHLDKATGDIEEAVHRLTRPPSLAKRIGMGLLDVGAKLGSIAAGFVR